MEKIQVSTVTAQQLLGKAANLTVGQSFILDGILIDAAGPRSLLLERFEVGNADTQVVVYDGGGQTLRPLSSRYYFKGVVDGEPGSFVFWQIDAQGHMKGIVHRGDLVHVSEHIFDADGKSLISQTREIEGASNESPFQCEADAAVQEQFSDARGLALRQQLQDLITSNGLAGKALTMRRADLYIETDYPFFQKFGNASAAANYITDLFAYVSARYQTEISARFNIKQIYLYSTSADPWTYSTTSGALDQLRTRWNAISLPRNHVHLLSSANLGGGVAYINSLNQPGVAYGVSGSIKGDFSLANPQIIWDSIVVAHEIGHAFGSDHTHAFAAPYIGSSVGGAIDQCTSGYLPGLGTATGGTSGQRGGLIMSYCHQVTGGYTNIGWSFGTNHAYGSNPSRVAQVMQSAAQAYLPADTATGSNTLSVSKAGSGTGAVTSVPEGINCGAACTATFPDTTTVTLTAIPGSDSSFAGWSGACSGTSSCIVGMQSAREVTATFNVTQRILTLTKTGTGLGTVTSSPVGISCGTSCTQTSQSFVQGTSVTLTASPASGSQFVGWSGACTGSALTCTVTLSASQTVSAQFNTAAASQYTLQVDSAGSGAGTVTSTPGGINCPGTCIANFNNGAIVTLQAMAASGSVFVGWSGACQGSGSCIVYMNGTKSVTANFATPSSAGVISGSVGSLASTVGSPLVYYMLIPTNAVNLVFRLSGGAGDADLMVKADRAASTYDYDCYSYRSNNDELCVIPASKAVNGQYFVRLEPYTDFTNVTLQISYEVPYTLTVSKTGQGQGAVVSTAINTSYAMPVVDSKSTRIVGGSSAASSAWPWQVSLENTSGSFFCGGALLSSTWVVTAAHCVVGNGSTLSPSAVRVRAGSLTTGYGGQLLGVLRIVVHGSYQSATFDNDIALLQLATPVLLNATVQPIEPISLDNEAIWAAHNDTATVTGWGTLSFGGYLPYSLQQASLPIISTAVCKAQSGYGNSITDNMICAGYMSGGKDSCQGDSGGPLVVANGRGSYALAGLVSNGIGCALPNYPGIYTRVANYRNWLSAETGISFDQPLIACGSSCSARFGANSTVTLSATSAVDAVFAGWTGACTGTGNCTVTMSEARNVVARFDISPVALERGSTVNNLAAATGLARYFQFTVPAGATRVVVSTSGGTGDADLYVRAGQLPSLIAYDCIQTTSGSQSSCQFDYPLSQNTTYYVMLQAYSAFSGVTLSVTWQPPEVPVTLTVRKIGIGQGTITSTQVVYPHQAGNTVAEQPRIVGGSVAANGAWPWQVQLSINMSGSNYRCGGSLIDARWVLTAAHCVVDANNNPLTTSSFSVRLGSNTWGSGGQVLGVSRVIRHSGYNPANKDNDMALLELSSSAVLSSTVATVRPLTPDLEPTLAANGILSTVTGWGTTSSGGSVSSSLMQVQMPLLDSATCAALSSYGNKITTNMICAGFEMGGKDSCQGDSGGPLVVPNKLGGYALAGVVSWGIGCAAADNPGVYARVANYLYWLKTQTGISLDTPLVNCSGTCTVSPVVGTTITLKATAGAGSTFKGWGGACSEAGMSDNCSVTLDQAAEVMARFTDAKKISALVNTLMFLMDK